MLFDNQQQQRNSVQEEITRPMMFTKGKSNSDLNGVSVFNAPSQTIYSKEKMPMVFHNENYGSKLAYIRKKIDTNIKEATFLGEKATKSTGVLGLASKTQKYRNSRPLTANPKQFSKVRGLKYNATQ